MNMSIWEVREKSVCGRHEGGILRDSHFGLRDPSAVLCIRGLRCGAGHALACLRDVRFWAMDRKA